MVKAVLSKGRGFVSFDSERDERLERKFTVMTLFPSTDLVIYIDEEDPA